MESGLESWIFSDIVGLNRISLYLATLGTFSQLNKFLGENLISGLVFLCIARFLMAITHLSLVINWYDSTFFYRFDVS